MFVLLGNRLMKEGDYEGAIKLFKRAHLQSLSQTRPHLKTISLVSDHDFVVVHADPVGKIFGWQLDGLAFSVRRQLCEALHAIGRMKETAEALLETVDTLGECIQTNEEDARWIAGECPALIQLFNVQSDTHCQSSHENVRQHLRAWATLQHTRRHTTKPLNNIPSRCLSIL